MIKLKASENLRLALYSICLLACCVIIQTSCANNENKENCIAWTNEVIPETLRFNIVNLEDGQDLFFWKTRNLT